MLKFLKNHYIPLIFIILGIITGLVFYYVFNSKYILAILIGLGATLITLILGKIVEFILKYRRNFSKEKERIFIKENFILEFDAFVQDSSGYHIINPRFESPRSIKSCVNIYKGYIRSQVGTYPDEEQINL